MSPVRLRLGADLPGADRGRCFRWEKVDRMSGKIISNRFGIDYSPGSQTALAGRCGENVEPADKPGSVEDDHSSGTYVAVRLKQPTRTQRGPRQWVPIWFCSGWSLPCRELLPAARCALTAPFHPYLIPQAGHRRFALCCTSRRLAPPRRYLAPCPMEPGLSSPPPVSPKGQRRSSDRLADSAADSTSAGPQPRALRRLGSAGAWRCQGRTVGGGLGPCHPRQPISLTRSGASSSHIDKGRCGRHR